MKINGYTVKAGSELLFNMSSILYDPVTFPEPRKFIPERFLGDNSNHRTTRSAVFGMGKVD